MHSVIELIEGTLKISHASYRDPALHVMEYHVQPSTAVSILGTYMPGNHQPIAAIHRPIEMSHVLFEEGQLEINCHIRTPFRVVQFNRSQCGQGQVTDGYYRLTVNIAAYTPNDNLTIGTAITMHGEMIREPPYFSVATTDNIFMGADNPLTREATRRGFNAISTARRRLADDQVVVPRVAINVIEASNINVVPAAASIIPIQAADVHVAPADGGIVPVQVANNHATPGGGIVSVEIANDHAAPAGGAIVPVQVANHHAAPAGGAIVPVEVANGHVAPGGAVIGPVQAANRHVAPRGAVIGPVQAANRHAAPGGATIPV
ncbi:uncharacterized protein LOC122849233 [Aphidius gifuensis]|uniref:uncharacterized protein LOC122849233 n=1 Tax=Aphidius gifuensis TaxID=684658 RepID=UPI001CDB8C99|nr:uncharacterized protein LOC122849233 [Aphidius gifuensis]XP_044003842.1 uncharacterized protein LOC122849233 [Aphidius gifuensis]